MLNENEKLTTSQLTIGNVQIPLSENGVELNASVINELGRSATATGIELRMLPPYIKENGSTPVWPFPGYSSLYCLTIVFSDVQNQLVGMFDLNGFPRIGDEEYLPINKTIYYWEKEKDTDEPPSQIHVMCQVIKSKESLRNVGHIMSEVQGSSDYKNIIAKLSGLATTAANFNIIAGIINEVAGIVGKYLGKVDDRPLAKVINSYTRVHGELTRFGMTDFRNNTSKVNFKFQLAIRDQQKEDMLTQPVLASLRDTDNSMTAMQQKVELNMTRIENMQLA